MSKEADHFISRLKKIAPLFRWQIDPEEEGEAIRGTPKSIKAIAEHAGVTPSALKRKGLGWVMEDQLVSHDKLSCCPLTAIALAEDGLPLSVSEVVDTELAPRLLGLSKELCKEVAHAADYEESNRIRERILEVTIKQQHENRS